MTYSTRTWLSIPNGRIFLFGWLLVTFSLVIPVQALLPHRENEVDRGSIVRSAATLEAAIRKAIENAGGDIEHQQIHLVLGFSTGHFAQDPLGAEAARGIAIHCIRNLLIRDDRLSVYAWEQHLWKNPQVSENPTTVMSDDIRAKTKLQDLFPLTPQNGSRGGHDTERALVEIIGRLHGDSSAVVVLLTNSGASVSRDGEKVIGADNPEYQQLLIDWQRTGQVSKTGASIVLPYTILSEGKTVRLRSFDAIIMTPKLFAGERIATGTRSSHLRIPQQHGTTPRQQHDSWLGMVLLLATIVLVGLAIYTRFFPRGGLLLEINGQCFDTSLVSEGGEICHLAGPEYSGACDRTVTVTSEDHIIPPYRLARFTKQRGKVVASGDKFKLYSMNGIVLSGAGLLFQEGKYRLVLHGEWSQDPALPPRPLQVEVAVEVIHAVQHARRA